LATASEATTANLGAFEQASFYLSFPKIEFKWPVCWLVLLVGPAFK